MVVPKKSPSRRPLAFIGAMIVLALVGFGVRQINGAPPPASRPAVASAVPVTAATAARQDVPEIVDAIGTVQSTDSVSIQPRVTGTIEKIEFTPGQNVKQGQELFLIDPRPYQAALDQAKAQLAHDQGLLAEAQMDLKRYQTLLSQKSIAAQTAQDQVYVVQQDQGTVALDQANVEMAQLNLDYCHITAPISGRAGTLQVDLGNLVGPASAPATSAASSRSGSGANSSTLTSTSSATSASGGLVSIEQLQPIYVSFSIPQTQFNEVAQNQANGMLAVDAYSQAGKLLEKGKLTIINNQVNTTTGTVTLQATFANGNDVLWPGEYVSVQLVVGVRRNVVTVPASAVMAGPNGDYVYVIGDDNKVTRVDVQQAARRAGTSVIGKGLSAGQRVVATGQYRLDNGTVVAVDQTPPPPQARNAALAYEVRR
jgi:multidrug efflux system membrane fusion protein